MTKREIENFLLTKPGYLKKSGINVLKRLWKGSPKNLLPKNEGELQKELNLVNGVMQAMRVAKTIEVDTSEETLQDLYHSILNQKEKTPRTLYFDIETSYNIVSSWNVGRKINLTPENIIEERKIITVCYKFNDEDKVHSLTWDKGNDKNLLEKFSKVMDSADVICGHNSDNFDTKHIRARCIYHNIPLSLKYNSIDTLKLARSGFKFNSAKLDYLGQFLGVGKKEETGGLQLWNDIILRHDKTALDKMVKYCIGDVLLLEKVHKKLLKYSPKKKFKIKLA